MVSCRPPTHVLQRFGCGVGEREDGAVGDELCSAFEQRIAGHAVEPGGDADCRRPELVERIARDRLGYHSPVRGEFVQVQIGDPVAREQLGVSQLDLATLADVGEIDQAAADPQTRWCQHVCPAPAAVTGAERMSAAALGP